MKLLLYCTKAKPYLRSHSEYEYNEKGAIPETRKRVFTLSQNKCDYYNGKIVAECDYEVEEYLTEKNWFTNKLKIINKKISEGIAEYSGTDIMLQNILNKSCLSIEELTKYMNFKECDFFGICYQEKLYAIHIKNLHIFDEPKELGKALIYNFDTQYIIEKAPQNMMKVYNRAGECHILTSIRPEWLCKILNGEKTIEVRKKVLKEMVRI